MAVVTAGATVLIARARSRLEAFLCSARSVRVRTAKRGVPAAGPGQTAGVHQDADLRNGPHGSASDRTGGQS